MRIGYADPPYPGCAHMYSAHPDYAGEVDHAALVARLESDFDGWVLHTHVPGLAVVWPLVAPLVAAGAVRMCSWVKTFAAFKRNVSVAYAWEPVFIKAARKPVVRGRVVKPEAVCRWAFELVGADDNDDIYPGTGAVTRAWSAWRAQPCLRFA